MQGIISEKEIEELRALKGQGRGTAMKSHLDFILKEFDKDGLNKVEAKLAEMGFDIKHENIKPMEFYPIYMEFAVFLAIKEVFNFDREKFREMGAFQTKISLIVRLFMKYFCSLEIMVKQVTKLWKEYYTVGELKLASIDVANKTGVIRIDNYTGYPYQCQGFEGYFSHIAKMVIKENVSCKEIKCVHKGDQYHEFLLKW